jgi:diguanylate cyclase (GGDEF)-like protein/PAS domain S-box-containing protein
MVDHALRSPPKGDRPEMDRRMAETGFQPEPAAQDALGPAGPEPAFDAVVAFEATRGITEFNPGAERLFGWTRAQALGRDLAELLFPGELQRHVLVDLAAMFDCGDIETMGRRIELVATRADGRRVAVELNVTCLVDGERRRFIALVRDIGGRRRLVEELRGHADRLAAIAQVLQDLAANEATAEGLVDRVAGMAQQVLDADGAAFALLEGDTLVYRAVSGALEPHAARRAGIHDSLAGLAVRENRALWCGDCESDTRVDAAACRSVGLRSMVVAPVPGADGTLGVIKAMSRAPHRFGEADAHALELFAASLATVLQRTQASERLRASENQYRMLFRDNPHPMWVFDRETLRFLAVNNAAVAQYGWSEGEFLAMTLRDIRAPGDVGELEHVLCDLPQHHRQSTGLWRHRRRNGEQIDVEVTSEAIEFGGREARLVLAHDVTSRVRAEQGQASAVRALRMLGACNEAMIRIDDEPRLLDEICRIVVEIGGYALAGVGYVRHDDECSLEPMAAAGDHPEVVHLMKLSWSAESPYGQGPAGRCIRSCEAIIYPDLREDGQGFPFRDKALALGYRSVVTLPLRSEDGCIGFLGMYAHGAQHLTPEELKLLQEMVDNVAFGIGALRERADRQRIQAELEYRAAHDAVTGLDRYVVLEPWLAAMLAAGEGVTAVLLVDLDRFSAVNEAVGHRHADAVLREVGRRLLAAAGPAAHVAHLAADEYVVAFAVADADAAMARADALREALSVPIEGDGYRLVVSATIGVSLAPAHGQTAMDLLRRAQAAMERGKLMGRDVSCAFLTEQMQDIEDRMTLGGALRGAARNGELQLHYQPQLRAGDGALAGFEALLRWRNPALGPVSPARFIPIAEALGLMPEIGAWVLREACRQVRVWHDAGHTDICVAVNVSAQQLQRPGLVQSVADAIAEHGIPAAMLDIELTESSLMENVARVQGTLAELKQLGVTLSLDDFGTGYSSLSYLKHFPLDKLKIDQSFVRGLPDNADDAAIARTIVSIGHQLRLQVAAEGVETEAQAVFLREIGCDELQGYHFGRPVPAEEAGQRFAAAP